MNMHSTAIPQVNARPYAVHRYPPPYPSSGQETLRMQTVKKIMCIAACLGLGTLCLLFIALEIPALTLTASVILLGISISSFCLALLLENQLKTIDFDLYNAASKGNRLMVKYLLFLGANPNNGTSTPLDGAIQRCAYDDNRGIIEDLLKAGTNVNKNTDNFESYLSKALNKKNTSFSDAAVKILLKWGANPNSKISIFKNALFKAAVLGRSEILEELIHAGVFIDDQDEDGDTALSTAIKYAQFNTVKALLKLGADTDETVLEKAAKYELEFKKGNPNPRKNILQSINEIEKIIELLHRSKEVKEVHPISYRTLRVHSTLPELPDEVMVSIFSYLSAKETARASIVCKIWHRIAADPFLWKNLCLRDFPPTLPLPTKNVDWKKNYTIYTCNANLAANKLKIHFQKTLNIPLKNARSLGMPFSLSPDGSKLAGIIFNKNQITLWDTVQGKCLRVISVKQNEFIDKITFSRDGSKIIASGHSYLGIWDLNGILLRLFNMGTGRYDISPDETKLLLTNRGQSEIGLYDISSNQVIRLATFGIKNARHLANPVAFSCDQKILTTNHNEINLWDINQLEAPLFTLSKKLNLSSIAFSQDGKMFAVGIFLGKQAWEIQLFETGTGQFIQAFPLYNVRPNKITFLANDKMLCCEDFNSSYFFNVDTGKLEGFRQGIIASSGRSFLQMSDTKLQVLHYVPQSISPFWRKWTV